MRLQATTVQALWHWGASGLDCSWFERRLSKNQNSKKKKDLYTVSLYFSWLFLRFIRLPWSCSPRALGGRGRYCGRGGGGLEHAAARLKLLSHHGCKIALCFEHLCKMTDSCPSWLSKAQVFFVFAASIYIFIYLFLFIYFLFCFSLCMIIFYLCLLYILID